MQTNAPGRGKLKVTGILYIIFGALGLLLSLALLAGGGLLLAAGAGTVGIALGAVAGILGAITVLTAVFYLILGILGVRNCDKPEKCGVNFVLGIIVLVLVVIGLVVNVATTGPSGALSSVVGLVLSILYVMGAKENKDAPRHGREGVTCPSNQNTVCLRAHGVFSVEASGEGLPPGARSFCSGLGPRQGSPPRGMVGAQLHAGSAAGTPSWFHGTIPFPKADGLHGAGSSTGPAPLAEPGINDRYRGGLGMQ